MYRGFNHFEDMGKKEGHLYLMNGEDKTMVKRLPSYG